MCKHCDQKKLYEWVQDKSIIRNKMKLAACVNNTQRFLEIQKVYGSFNNYIWGFVNDKPIVNSFKSSQEVPVKTELSEKISADLKRRRYKFVGSTVIYAHMQATGMVNDHLVDCFRYSEVQEVVSQWLTLICLVRHNFYRFYLLKTFVTKLIYYF